MEHLTAKNGWRALGALVVGYEIICPQGETLSEGVDNLMESYPAAKAIVGVLGVVTVAHLINAIPQKVDPFHYLLFWKD